MAVIDRNKGVAILLAKANRLREQSLRAASYSDFESAKDLTDEYIALLERTLRLDPDAKLAAWRDYPWISIS